MKTFTSWATENNLKIPAVTESIKRGGLAPYAYPDAYVRGQYPSNYFTPIAADAPFKLGATKIARGGPKEMIEN
jgi:hypothetical protein